MRDVAEIVLDCEHVLDHIGPGQVEILSQGDDLEVVQENPEENRQMHVSL